MKRCGTCRFWRFKSDTGERAFGVCDSPKVAEFTKIVIHGRPDLRQEIEKFGRLETEEKRFGCIFHTALKGGEANV